MNAKQEKTALIVEDEPLIVLELEETLQELGYNEVVAYSNVNEAMAWLEGALPAIAIIDYHIRNEVADELILALSASAVPIVIYSGRLVDPDVDSDILMGCEWLTKPADERMLALAISRACGLADHANIG